MRDSQQEQQAQLQWKEQAIRQAMQQHVQRAASMERQMEQVGRTLAEAFEISARTMGEITRLRREGNDSDATRLQAALDSLRSELASQPEDYIQFVTRYAEMQKHVSLWELHLRESGQAVLTADQQRQAFAFADAEEFVARAFQASKSLAEPRTLVIILLTYGDTQAVFRQQAIDAMPELTARLRQDSENTRWYDFSLLGYRPGGPLLYP
jgi:hypothetical protein